MSYAFESASCHATSAHELLDGEGGAGEDDKDDAGHQADVSNTPAWHLETHLYILCIKLNLNVE